MCQGSAFLTRSRARRQLLPPPTPDHWHPASQHRRSRQCTDRRPTSAQLHKAETLRSQLRTPPLRYSGSEATERMEPGWVPKFPSIHFPSYSDTPRGREPRERTRPRQATEIAYRGSTCHSHAHNSPCPSGKYRV